MGNFERGIPLSVGFSLSAQIPLDTRLVLQNMTELAALPEIQRYVGMYVYLIDEDIQLRYTSHGWEINHTGYTTGHGAPTNDSGHAGDMYIDVDTADVYFRVVTNPDTLESEWQFQLSIKGDKGDQGDKGATGTRGSKWYSGDKITGESTTAATFPTSGIASALIGDHYLHLNGNVYICTYPGTPDAAEWAYVTSIKGPKGDKGDKGSGIVTGNAIYGDINNPDGQNFPMLEDDGEEYHEGDLYLNDDTGELYKALGGGPTIDTVIWMKLGTLISTNNTNEYSFDVILHAVDWVQNEDGIWTLTYDLNDILVSVLSNVFASDITDVETVPSVNGTIDEVLEIFDKEILCKEILYTERLLTFHSNAKPTIDVTYTLTIANAKHLSSANIQEIIDAITKKIENPIYIEVVDDEEMIIMSSDRENTVFDYITMDVDSEKELVTITGDLSLFDKIAFNNDPDNEYMELLRRKDSMKNNLIIDGEGEMVSILGNIDSLNPDSVVFDEENELVSISRPGMRKGGSES